MTNETVEVNLSLGPYLYGQMSQWITDVDDYNGYVYISDGTTFAVHPHDQYLLWNWEPEEHLIIGTNDGRGNYSYPQILVNVASVTNVRVTPVN